MISQSSKDIASSSSSQNMVKTFSKNLSNSMELNLQDKDEGIEMKDIVFDQDSILVSIEYSQVHFYSIQ